MNIDSALVAVVVGGASGLGEATVRALRAVDVSVTILDSDTIRGPQIATQTGAAFFHLDVTDEESVIRAFDQARQKFGQERALVHTPAIGGGVATVLRDPQTGAINRHNFALFEKVVRVNLSGTFLCASVSAAGMMTLPTLASGGRGAIVLTSSIASEDAPAGLPAYVASKAGVNGLTLAMAHDLGPEGIRVNTILPGSFETPMIVPVPDAFKAKMLSWITHPKRFGYPDEYASMALELLRNGYMNGAMLRLDGAARAGG